MQCGVSIVYLPNKVHLQLCESDRAGHLLLVLCPILHAAKVRS